MPRLEDLPAPDRLEVETTRKRLDDLFHTVLTDMERSNASLTFPEPVIIKSFTLDSVTTKTAAGIVKKLHEERQLLIAVDTTFNTDLYRVGQFNFGGDDNSAKFIGVFFVGNFIARCNAMGTRAARDIVQKAVNLIVFNDAIMTANETKRVLVQPTSSLVSIFAGKRVSGK
jgi:hypothetical protein